MRKEKVIEQLKHYFENEAQDFENYNDKIWNDKYIQPNDDVIVPPHFNNGHSLFWGSYMNNKLFLPALKLAHNLVAIRKEQLLLQLQLTQAF